MAYRLTIHVDRKHKDTHMHTHTQVAWGSQGVPFLACMLIDLPPMAAYNIHNTLLSSYCRVKRT